MEVHYGRSVRPRRSLVGSPRFESRTPFHGWATLSECRRAVTNGDVRPPGGGEWKLGPWSHWILPPYNPPASLRQDGLGNWARGCARPARKSTRNRLLPSALVVRNTGEFHKEVLSFIIPAFKRSSQRDSSFCSFAGSYLNLFCIAGLSSFSGNMLPPSDGEWKLGPWSHWILPPLHYYRHNLTSMGTISNRWYDDTWYEQTKRRSCNWWCMMV